MIMVLALMIVPVYALQLRKSDPCLNVSKY